MINRLKCIARREGISLSHSHCQAIFNASNYDVRQSILTMQFWKKVLGIYSTVSDDLILSTPLHRLIWGMPDANSDSSSSDGVAASLKHLRQQSLHHRLAPQTHDSDGELNPLLIRTHPGEFPFSRLKNVIYA